jgi:hypothetical protein
MMSTKSALWRYEVCTDRSVFQRIINSKLKDVAFPEIARLAQGLEIFLDRVASMAPWLNVIDMQ